MSREVGKSVKIVGYFNFQLFASSGLADFRTSGLFNFLIVLVLYHIKDNPCSSASCEVAC